MEPLPPDQTAPPVRLRMPALELDAAVEPMGWDVVMADGKETTQWIVPEGALGWQVNSIGAGGQGNLVIAGQQAVGDALLAPLALGEVEPGQEILVTDDEGLTFRYVVTEVSDPIPLAGASDDELAQESAYAALDGDARLTLITGWPDFTTTHRVFAVAEFAGLAE
jgi:sortase (surface protein transpeptidase)